MNCSTFKQGFTNRNQANQIAQKTNRKRDKALNVYRCVECSKFHIGTPSHKFH